MATPQMAEELAAQLTGARDVIKRTKETIAERAQLYAAAYLFAFFACGVLAFYHSGWVRWIAGFFTAGCLLTAWTMRGMLATLRRAYATIGVADAVLGKHRAMNFLSMVLLIYACLAIWSNWPIPVLAVFVAAIINFLHYIGYNGRPSV